MLAAPARATRRTGAINLDPTTNNNYLVHNNTNTVAEPNAANVGPTPPATLPTLAIDSRGG